MALLAAPSSPVAGHRADDDGDKRKGRALHGGHQEGHVQLQAVLRLHIGAGGLGGGGEVQGARNPCGAAALRKPQLQLQRPFSSPLPPAALPHAVLCPMLRSAALTSSTAAVMVSNCPVARSSAYAAWSMGACPSGVPYAVAGDSRQRCV